MHRIFLATLLLSTFRFTVAADPPQTVDPPVQQPKALEREKLAPVRVIDIANVYAAELAGDGSCLACVPRDHAVRILETATGREIAKLAGHDQPITHLAISHDGSRVSGYSAEAARLIVWTVAGAKKVVDRKYDGNGATARACAFSRDGNTLAACVGGQIQMIDTRTGAVRDVASDKAPYGVCDAKLLRDGKTLLMADSDGKFHVWDLAANRAKGTGIGHDAKWETLVLSWRPPVRLFLSPDETRAATFSTWYDQLRVWNVADVSRVFDNQGQSRRRSVHSCAFSPDAKRLATTERDGLIGFWNTADGSLSAAFTTGIWYLRWVSYLPDGATLVTLDEKGFKFWNATEGQSKVVKDTVPPAELTLTYVEAASLESNVSREGIVSFSSDGKRLAVPGEDGCEEFDLADGRRIRTWSTPQTPYLKPFAISADAGLVGRHRAGMPATVWNFRTGKQVCELESPWPFAGSGELSPDGALLAWSGRQRPDGPLRFALWDARTGRRLDDLPGVVGVTFSADGKTAAMNLGTAVSLRTLPDGKEIAEFDAGYGRVRSMILHPGRLIVGAAKSEDVGWIDFWNLADKKLQRRLVTSLYDNVGASADGKVLVGSRPGRDVLRVWNGETFEVLRTFRDSEDWVPVPWLRMASDGKHFAIECSKHWSLFNTEHLTDIRQLDVCKELRSQFTFYRNGRLELNLEQSVTDDDLAAAARLRSPTLLEIQYCGNITDAGIKRLASARAVVGLKLPDKVTDAGLAALSKLNLRLFSARGDGISDAGLAVLAGMTEMTELDVYGEKVTLGCLRHFAKMGRLRSLSLSGEVTDAELPGLLPLTAMENLSVRLNLTDAGLARLAAAMPRLRKLNLSGSKITDKGLAALSRLTDLRELNLSETGISDIGLLHLRGLTEMENLDLSDNPAIRGTGFIHLSGMTRLSQIDLDDTGVNGTGLQHLASTLVTILDLNDVPVDDAGLESIGKLTRLVHLKLSGRITDAGLKHLAGMEGLESLTVQGSALTGVGCAVLENLPRFGHLALTDCRLTDAGLAAIGRLHRLEHLSLERCPITDAGLARLAGLVSLKGLNLSNTRVTDAGTVHLRRMYALEYLGNENTALTENRRDEVTEHKGDFARPYHKTLLGKQEGDVEEAWFSPDGSTLHMWRKRSLDSVPAVASEKPEIASVAVDKGEDIHFPQVVVSRSTDLTAVVSLGEVHLYSQNRFLRTLPGKRDDLLRPAFSGDGKRLLLVFAGKLQICTTADGAVEREITLGFPFSKTVGPLRTTGGRIAGLSAAGPVLVDEETVLVIDLARPDAAPRRLSALTSVVSGMTVTGDGSRIAAAGWGEFAVWEAASGKLLSHIRTGDTTMEHIAFSNDGKLLAARGTAGGIHIYEMDGARRHVNLKETGDEYINGFCFSPDGKRLAIHQRSFGPSVIRFVVISDFLPPLPTAR